MWFKQIKNVISSCRRCSIHNTPAHWKCWCNGGEQGWMSTAHHKEATSVDHNNTFHPFGVKEIRKKNNNLVTKRQSLSWSLCSAPAGPQTPTRASVTAREHGQRKSRRRRGSEGGVLCWEREEERTTALTQIPGQQQLTRTYWINTDFTKRLWKLKFTELMSKKHFYRPKAQIFCHPIPFSPH